MAALRSLYSKSNIGLRLTAQRRAVAMLSLLLLVGAAFSIFNVPLASSAANTIQVAHVDQAIPTDPQSPLWNDAKESTIPLSSQQIYQPGGGRTQGVMVRALENGTDFAIRVSWDDATKNDTVGNVPSDAAAIQLPIDPTHLPYQCMGQSNNRVNIWQWKAALEREGLQNLGALSIDNAGVRNLTSNGICRAVDTPGLEPHATSYHDGKRWYVVFYRALSQGGAGSAPLLPTQNTSAAFAVWNGQYNEAKGMKAVSSWNPMQFVTPAANNTAGIITLGVVLLLSVGAVIFTMRRMAGS